jgi:integrase
MFLKWLKINDYTEIDLHLPLNSVKFAAVKANEQKEIFTKSDLKKIFNSDVYLKGLHKKPSHFWVPLIGIFSGARLNEICQLSITDIYIESTTDRWVIDINENLNDDPNKSLKKPFHKRLVPVHKKLIELGFVDYFEYQKKKRSKRLFPDLIYVSHVNKYGDHLQRWFNRTYLKSICEVKTNNTSFHSLRHTVITHLVNDKNVDPNKIAEALGQTPQGGVTQQNYTKRLPLKDYAKHFDLIDFGDCFDTKLIRPWKRHTFMYETNQKSNLNEKTDPVLTKNAKSTAPTKKTTAVKKSTPAKKTVTKSTLRKTKTT